VTIVNNEIDVNALGITVEVIVAILQVNGEDFVIVV